MTVATPERIRRLVVPRYPMAALVCLGAYVLGLVLGGLGAYSSGAGEVSLEPESQPVLALFTHNLGVLAWLTAGLVTGGVAAVAVLGLNGMVLGWIAAKILATDRGSALVTGVLPHLPFELLAYVVSAAASLRLGLVLAQWLRHRELLPPALWRGWWVSQGVALLLLLVAAIVERSFAHV